ncbi:tetratricopeptide repeat protein [Campylobacter taeniopygiae]|uniref:beta-lactamase n=1 Tax=Campylobacter taeniopygiae TaxID=2510188 RepID=A0ABY2TMF1_9BACT|nr:tetratricopeptide repeat protein [Campylobacter taeniopygiae]TKX34625.1 hypothetical protein CQA75_01550 [Campylobacter taeniopygiae]
MKQILFKFLILNFLLVVCACSQDGSSVDDLFKKGQEALKSGDRDKAIEYLKQACNLNSGLRSGFSCYQVGNFYRNIVGDTRKSSEYYEKACDLNLGLACFASADTYRIINPDKALNYYKKACDLEISQSCVELANLYIEENNASKFLEYLNKACDSKDAKTCNDLAKIYEQGVIKYKLGIEDKEISIKKDSSKALQYYKKACDEAESNDSAKQDYCEKYHQLKSNF